MLKKVICAACAVLLFPKRLTLSTTCLGLTPSVLLKELLDVNCNAAQSLPALPGQGPPRPDVKFFTGYAGWGAGQLQRECNEDVWWVVAGAWRRKVANSRGTIDMEFGGSSGVCWVCGMKYGT